MCGSAVEQIMSAGNETELALEGIEPSTIVSTLTFMNGIMFVGFFGFFQFITFCLANFRSTPSSIPYHTLLKTPNLRLSNCRHSTPNNDTSGQCHWSEKAQA